MHAEYRYDYEGYKQEDKRVIKHIQQEDYKMSTKIKPLDAEQIKHVEWKILGEIAKVSNDLNHPILSQSIDNKIELKEFLVDTQVKGFYKRVTGGDILPFGLTTVIKDDYNTLLGFFISSKGIAVSEIKTDKNMPSMGNLPLEMTLELTYLPGFKLEETVFGLNYVPESKTWVGENISSSLGIEMALNKNYKKAPFMDLDKEAVDRYYEVLLRYEQRNPSTIFKRDAR